MGLAKGTSPWLTFPLSVALIGILIIFVSDELMWVGIALFVPSILLFLFLLNFFRDPERKIGDGIVSPADGIVTEVRQGPPFYVSIFMNVHDVHVNRMPCKGRIESVKHIPGGFVPAFDKDSDRNERFVTCCVGDSGEFQMTQIAGAVARRIIPYVKKGDELEKGERFGMIRLGSRVDLELEGDVVVKVKKGQRVKAGVTTLAVRP